MSRRANEFMRVVRRFGWRVQRTGGDHLRLSHPLAARPVFAPLTPGDHRAYRNTIAAMRRSLRVSDRRPPGAPIVTTEAPIRCPRCGHGRARLAPGKGPHAASWRCERCDRFIGWVSKRLLGDLLQGELTDALERHAPPGPPR